MEKKKKGRVATTDVCKAMAEKKQPSEASLANGKEAFEVLSPEKSENSLAFACKNLTLNFNVLE